MYRVNNWERHFEGAKSKTYNNKTSCSIPTKHGLGYRRLIRSKNGPALFGAWCALIQVLSRHPKPRKGYCTDTGCSDGVPYTFEDLELLTDIPAKYFEQMLNICKSHSIGWVSLTGDKGTMVDCEGTIVDCEEAIVPLNLDSDLDSDLDLCGKNAARRIVSYYNNNRGLMPECKAVTDQRVSTINKRIDDYGTTEVLSVIDKAKASDFLQGRTEACFKCGIDWIMGPKNFPKIMEGNYETTSAKSSDKPQDPVMTEAFKKHYRLS